MCKPSTHTHTQTETNGGNTTHTHTVTYFSGLHSGTLSVGVTDTDGQFVSVRWTQTDTTEENKTKQIISS